MNAPLDTRREAALAMTTAMVMIAVHITGKAARDALFLSRYDVADLPRMMIGAAVVAIASALCFSALLARFGPARVIPVAFGLSALALAGEWFVVKAAPDIGAVVLYLHVAAFGSGLISGFWSVVNERFDPHSAKRMVSRLSAAAALGGVVGGLAAERLSTRFGLPATLILMASMHAVCGLCIGGIRVPAAAPPPSRETGGEGSAASGLAILRATPYLQQIAAVVALCAIVDALLDYALKSAAAARFVEEASLVQFFVIFYIAVNVLTFAVQAIFGNPVLRRWGLGGAMLTLPWAAIGTGLVGVAAPRIWTVVAARGLSNVASTSLFRAGFELLYTPVPPQTKRPTKVFIDVGARRLGDLLGSGLVLLGVTLLVDLPTWMVMAAAVLVSVGVLLAVRATQRGYVDQLASSLRAGLVSFEDSDVVDATTARTIAATQMALDREQILQLIREREPAADDGPSEPASEAVRPVPPAAVDDPVVGWVAGLHARDPRDARDVLDAASGETRLVPHVIGLLDRRELADDAMAFLRDVAPRSVGALVDGLLDESLPPAVRRRLARVLEVCDDARAVDGLRRALADPPPAEGTDASERFSLRFHCAQAAARIIARNPELALDPEAVYVAVRQELGVSERTWERLGRRSRRPESSVLLEGSSLSRIPRSVEHVFTLLSLGMDRETMASTLAGLYSGDERLRGTALELLEMSLPRELREQLLVRLRHRPPAHPVPTTARARAELADELLRSSADVVVRGDRLR